jgi:N12 class adenine-specific DNA methylase
MYGINNSILAFNGNKYIAKRDAAFSACGKAATAGSCMSYALTCNEARYLGMTNKPMVLMPYILFRQLAYLYLAYP